jgi:hypothetical protein
MGMNRWQTANREKVISEDQVNHWMQEIHNADTAEEALKAQLQRYRARSDPADDAQAKRPKVTRFTC